MAALKAIAIILLVLFLVFLLLTVIGTFFKLADVKKSEIPVEIIRASCVRTYIPRVAGDAIKCTQCSFEMSDGSSINKEGC